MIDASHRKAVMNLYPNSDRWKRRVKNMPDAQIFAIYKKRIENPQKSRKVKNESDSSRDLF